MSNLETLQIFYEAVAKEDMAGILGPLSDQIAWDVWDPPSPAQEKIPYMAPRHGKAEVPGFFEALQVSDWHRFEPAGFIDGGDQIAVRILIDATAKMTGTRYQDEQIHHWTFGADGKITAFRHFSDTDKTAKALNG